MTYKAYQLSAHQEIYLYLEILEDRIHITTTTNQHTQTIGTKKNEQQNLFGFCIADERFVPRYSHEKGKDRRKGEKQRGINIKILKQKRHTIAFD